MSNANRSMWLFPRNEPGKVLGWETITGKYLENKAAGSAMAAELIDDDTFATASSSNINSAEATKAYADTKAGKTEANTFTEAQTISGAGLNMDEGQSITFSDGVTSSTIATSTTGIITMTPGGAAKQVEIVGDTLRVNSTGGAGIPQLILKSTNSIDPNGEGAFVRFNTLSTLGTPRDGLLLNGGLVDATHGAEDGLLDIGAYRAGTYSVHLTLDASLSSFFPGNQSGNISLGLTNKLWNGLHLAQGSAINWNNGAVTLTGNADDLTMAGGQLLLPAGTSALPAQSFSGDPDTGWFSVSANVMRGVTGGNARLTLQGSSVQCHVAMRLPSFTVGTVPSASTSGEGAMIYVSNEAGGATPAFSDGTNWKRVSDLATIS